MFNETDNDSGILQYKEYFDKKPTETLKNESILFMRALIFESVVDGRKTIKGLY